MNILVGTDYYYPSGGGQQIVLKEISERLVKRGHTVTVATSKRTDRQVTIYNGVNIKEFKINGSYVHGLVGNIQEYHELSETFNPAKNCHKCGECQQHCPQNLEVIENLKKVSEVFD